MNPITQQKTVFLESEGDAWYRRNRAAYLERDFGNDDSVVAAVVQIASLPGSPERLRVLEVGCGEGARLQWLASELNADVSGIEPSALAVKVAQSKGVDAHQGVADALPFESASFDIVIFGFCLYLCDREDLFRISQEADRVLKPKSWLVINDFFASTPVHREYHHKPGLKSFKMDYRSMFVWHPAYICYSHSVVQHGQCKFTDDVNEWVATSVIRKKISSGE